MKHMLAILTFLFAMGLSAAEIHVDYENGKNDGNGSKENPYPNTRIAAGLAKPGDLIRIAKASKPIRNNIFIDKADGTQEKPIVIDAGFNTFLGTVPLDPAQFISIGNNVYKTRAPRSMIPGLRYRYFFLYQGKRIGMGQSSKTQSEKLKKVGDLKDLEWTLERLPKSDTNPNSLLCHLYFKVPAGKTLESLRIEEPAENLHSGIVTEGKIRYVTVKNAVVKNFWNDGSNFHYDCRGIVVENIAAIECNDDGTSAHETCEVTARNYLVAGCHTGFCHVQQAKFTHENFYITDIIAKDIYLLNTGGNSLKNIVIEGSSKDGIHFTDGPCDITDSYFIARKPQSIFLDKAKCKVSVKNTHTFGYTDPTGLPFIQEKNAASIDKQAKAMKAKLLKIFADGGDENRCRLLRGKREETVPLIFFSAGFSFVSEQQEEFPVPAERGTFPGKPQSARKMTRSRYTASCFFEPGT